MAEFILNALSSLATLVYLAALGICVFHFARADENGRKQTSRVLFAAVAIHTLWLVVKTLRLGFFPFGNWFDCISFIAWAIAIGYIYIELTTKDRRMAIFVLPVVFLFQVLAWFQLLGQPLVTRLPETLQSPLFGIHIGAALFACSAFSLSFCLSLSYLLLSQEIRLKRLGFFFRRLPPLGNLERMNYRVILLGFLLLTIAIVSGGIWMEQIPDHKWLSDPKQILSVVLWLLYAGNLHTRYMMGWQGSRTALFSSLNFIFLAIVIIAASLMGNSFHHH